MSNFRSVLDTNVVLAGKRTAHPSSPNREIIERWLLGEFTLLYSLDLLLEYAEKLTEHGIPDSEPIRQKTVASETEWSRFRDGSKDLPASRLRHRPQ
jgi:hypothetical protein